MNVKVFVMALLSVATLGSLYACSDESATIESVAVDEPVVTIDKAAVDEIAVTTSVSVKQICDKGRTPTAPTENYGFVKGDDRIVIDNGYRRDATMWMRCALGQEWDGKTCAGEPKLFAWHEVHQLAAKYNEEKFGGFDHWRVPFLPELMTLRETNCSNPAINTEIFASAPAVFFWSSMPAVDDLDKMQFSKDEAYGADFNTGAFGREKISKMGAVRLIHDGPDGPAWQNPFANNGAQAQDESIGQ